MRRAAPFIIVIIGALALFFDFWPNVTVPPFGDTTGTAAPRRLEWKLGLDLQGGFRVEYQAQPVGGKVPTSADMNTIRDIIERRVNSTGVSEPVVQTQGSDRVVVELPGVQDSAQIEQLVGSTGRLDFVPLPPAQYGTGSTTGNPTAVVVGQPLPIPEPALFSGDQVSSANPSTDSIGNRAVAFSLKSQGSTLFATYTSQHVGQFFAIVLDNNVVSAPVIQSAITGGNGIITGGTGGFTAASMNSLVTILRYGSLPFPIQAIQRDDIPATLGAQFLQQTLLAAAIGIALVFAFMLIYYRLPGVVASFALAYYTLVVLAVFRLIPVTLTLAGIAGFVLSVGMAVDANILIFERSKEEMRLGKPLTAAIEAGFARAWNSILDSNVSSLITAFILYWFGTSTIKGFALVLIIGVLTSMFTAITVTRTILRFVVRQDWARTPRMYGVREDEFAGGRLTGRPAYGGGSRTRG
ncbi:MAG: protein translocase subunit SecD [Chloroflexi bacterium]|nr:protein translocase subunit SecD [Chloroflexota bacterium]